MITFLIFPFVLVGSPIAGALLTAIIAIVTPSKLSDSQGAEPIFYVVMIAATVTFALLFLFVGGWMTLPFFTFIIGGILGLPLCIRFAPYIDDLKAFLWTPQQAGKRKEAMPCYPKPEPFPEQEEPMAMAYYSRD